MRFPPSLLDEIRARLPVSAVVGRRVKLKRQGREYIGLSPFKVEKTPSFTVNDQKGFYHCFSTGEHGDIFTFVMKTEGLAFPEAVERLAGEAGVAMPKPSPRAQEEHDRRARLYALMEAAARYFEAALVKPAGREALRYAEGRGLSRDTITRFRLGYAPASRSALKEHLAAAGYSAQEMAESGMLIAGPDIPVSYDRFRNRLMFPICDLKERVIAFGGRALEAEAKPKYLNSPETPLFHKGAQLFNAAKARPHAYDHGRVLVVEGYMDAIALSQAGFPEVVAPLGTALTAEQLALLWRLDPEPTLCFDGDAAGRKAAYRAVETALPHLTPGHSLKFAFLPDGLDPDDLVRERGGAGMDAVLKAARPLVQVLWDREWASGDWSTPERRARLEVQISELVGRIGDGRVRSQYGQEMRQRLAEVFGRPGQRTGGGGRPGRSEPAGRTGRSPFPRSGSGGGAAGPRGAGPAGLAGLPPQATSSLRASSLAAEGEAEPVHREALILCALINHPWLLEDWSEKVAALTLHSRALTGLRDAILEAHALRGPLDSAALRDQLKVSGQHHALAAAERAITHRSDRFAQPDADRHVAEAGWLHIVALHDLQGLELEVRAAAQAYVTEQTEEAFERLRDLKERLLEARAREARAHD